MSLAYNSTRMEVTQLLIDVLVEQMTKEEKVALLGGANMWETVSIPRLGIGSIKTTDGPAGARGSVWFGGSTSALIPCGISLAATFSLPLIDKVGELLATETKSKNAHVLLAPTINMSRSPFGGRNFENFGEDPFLTGAMATNIVAGIQRGGVGACVKHFVGNEQESRRFNIDEHIDERTLREVYLRPFQMVMESDPWIVMTSYNKVNGEHVDSSKRLLQDILRDEWKFKGMTISDWGGTNSVVESVIAGTDLEMPGPPVMRGEALLKALNKNEILEADLRSSVERILFTASRADLLGPFPDFVKSKMQSEIDKLEDSKQKWDELLKLSKRAEQRSLLDREDEKSNDLPEHRELLRKIATNGITLLQNNGILPIDTSKLNTVAIIGPNARKPTSGGSGSAGLDPHYTITPYDALEVGMKSLNPNIKITHETAILSHKLLPVLGDKITTPEGDKPGLRMDFYNGYNLEGEIVGTSFWSSTNIFLMTDGDLPESLRGKPYSFRLSGILTAPKSGVHKFGISSIGKAKLFVDDVLLIDNTEWTELGDTFMNCGSKEAIAEIVLECNVKYRIRLDQAATPPPMKPHDNTLFAYLSGSRIGLLPPIDEEKMMADAVQSAQDADIAILVIGMNNDWEREGVDRNTLQLPCRTDELITAVCKANLKTIVVNQSACAVAMPWREMPMAIVQAWYQGQENGNAIADVLLGFANPSGKLPITFPKKIEDHGTALCFPGDLENDRTEYAEGVFSGYKWFDKHDIEPLWPFGFGLSYTSFEISDIATLGYISEKSAASITLKVKNTGGCAGAEVVQLYVSDSDSIASAGLDSVRKSLKGFSKVELQPGEEKEISIVLGSEAVSWYDVGRAAWRVDPGTYTVYVGTSSRNIKGKAMVTVK